MQIIAMNNLLIAKLCNLFQIIKKYCTTLQHVKRRTLQENFIMA